MIYIVTNQKINPLFLETAEIEAAFTIISVEEGLNGIQRLGNTVGVDTETTGFDIFLKKILTLQIGNHLDQYVFDNTVDLKILKSYFEDKEKVFVFHNAKFDLKFLYRLDIIPFKVFDTYLAERLLYLGYPPGLRGMSLKDCVENYLGVSLNKEIRGLIHREGLTLRVLEYAANDVKYSVPLMDCQLKELIKKDLITAIDIENEFVKALAYIEYCGIKLDEEKWSKKMFNDSVHLFEARESLNKWVIDNAPAKYKTTIVQGDLFTGFPSASCKIAWSSPKQVGELFEELGFNITVKDKLTGKLKKSVDAKVIEPQKHISNIAQLYLDYKGWEKVVSTYGQTFINQINPVTKRIHTQFNQLMETGRLSSGGKDKDTGEDYINLQNIPADHETRACFVSEEGNVLIDCDFTAQEDLVFTELSQEPKLIELYNSKEKRDGHSLVAKMCFPDELKDVSEADVKHVRPDLRSTAKKAKFSIN